MLFVFEGSIILLSTNSSRKYVNTVQKLLDKSPICLYSNDSRTINSKYIERKSKLWFFLQIFVRIISSFRLELLIKSIFE